jgi:hypothetical protein
VVRIFSISAPNPMSSMRSASSTTMVATPFYFNEPRVM